ncbi:endopeptidase La [Salinispira pacifica]|uniref:Lon protease n=1 Tax=Salinispira pacifica TaxID=1307761 RepID=V5WJ43_9SPIO|nr:endopeptidase La [Salinispira pacifica]AHC15857.1 ATP-dependent protease LaType I [Salinispira pacifica]
MKIFTKPKAGGAVNELPLIAIKDLVLFPHSASPVYIQKSAGLKSVEQAMSGKRQIMLAYFSGDETALKMENLNTVGTVARIVQVMKLPNNSSRILLEGVERGEIQSIHQNDGIFTAKVQSLSLENQLTPDVATRMRALQDNFKTFARDNKKIPRELLQAIGRADNPHNLIDQILSQTGIPYQRKLEFLNQTDTIQRLDDLALELESETEIQSLRKDISKRVKQRMDDNHREFVINEQIKELNKELGKEESDPTGVKELERHFEQADLPEEVQAKVETELKRLKRLQPISPEAGILRGYLEWIADLPWNNFSEDRIDLDEAASILDQDHYNMKEPKDRILDFLAVLQMKQNMKGPILCFVGPPGTGKTSLGKSLARAMGREFVRISLGGVRDEAEIRGHRRTYVGALPGKIIQGLKRAGSSNPVFLLDEIDKLSSDHRGDPSSALLEVLDPEQNKNFVDHYMEVAVDLSKVLFVTTANSLHGIPYPLLDRMEIIQIPGYTSIEKSKIAEGFIIPKQLKEHGLDWADVKFSKEAVKTVIDGYTRESGVRNLEREIAKALRKIARKAVEDGIIPPQEVSDTDIDSGEAEPSETDQADKSDTPQDVSEQDAAEQDGSEPDDAAHPEFKFHVGTRDVKKLLGTRKFDTDILYKDNPAGLVYGMAWTELGGKLLPVEAIILNPEGSGDMTLTGSLGDVMKESARIALSVARKIIEDGVLEVESDIAVKADIHIHVPEGAIPKDGPSAGITLTTALLSIFSGKQLPEFTAMTGEITLTGRILPVGGIKEKVLAAHRNGFKTILLPAKNSKDYEELPPEVKKAVTFHFVEDIHQAISHIFLAE